MLSRGRRRSHLLELTTFDKGVNVRGRVHIVTRDDHKVGNWFGACRGGDKEVAGLWRGLDPGGSRLRCRGTGGLGSSARGEGWGGLVGCFKGDI